MKMKYRTVINVKNMKSLQGEGNVMFKNAHGTCTEHMNTYQKNITTDFNRTPTERQKHHKIREKTVQRHMFGSPG